MREKIVQKPKKIVRYIGDLNNLMRAKKQTTLLDQLQQAIQLNKAPNGIFTDNFERAKESWISDGGHLLKIALINEEGRATESVYLVTSEKTLFKLDCKLVICEIKQKDSEIADMHPATHYSVDID